MKRSSSPFVSFLLMVSESSRNGFVYLMMSVTHLSGSKKRKSDIIEWSESPPACSRGLPRSCWRASSFT